MTGDPHRDGRRRYIRCRVGPATPPPGPVARGDGTTRAARRRADSVIRQETPARATPGGLARLPPGGREHGSKGSGGGSTGQRKPVDRVDIKQPMPTLPTGSATFAKNSAGTRNGPPLGAPGATRGGRVEVHPAGAAGRHARPIDGRQVPGPGRSPAERFPAPVPNDRRDAWAPEPGATTGRGGSHPGIASRARPRASGPGSARGCSRASGRRAAARGG